MWMWTNHMSQTQAVVIGAVDGSLGFYMGDPGSSIGSDIQAVLYVYFKNDLGQKYYAPQV